MAEPVRKVAVRSKSFITRHDTKLDNRIDKDVANTFMTLSANFTTTATICTEDITLRETWVRI